MRRRRSSRSREWATPPNRRFQLAAPWAAAEAEGYRGSPAQGVKKKLLVDNALASYGIK